VEFANQLARRGHMTMRSWFRHCLHPVFRYACI
jgi:hypothetical protein